MIEVAVIGSVEALGRATWDAVATAVPGSPFLHWGFLSALEEANAVGPRAGWVAQHFVARLTVPGLPARIVGLAPAWLKSHSMGEFVYDWAWADAAERAGLRYYPKLVIGAAFSPVTGPRLLVDPTLDPGLQRQIKRALLVAALDHARANDVSGVHLLFCTEDELAIAQELGMAHRLGCQFHWADAGYADFDAFLARFPSKRRNQIRRERRRVQEQGVTLTSQVGAEVEDRWIGTAFDFYGATVDRYVWGRRYLSKRVFELLWERMRPYLNLVLARRGDEVVGGSLNLQSHPDPRLLTARAASPTFAAAPVRRFGRYWGALAEVQDLHFEVCSYYAIEDSIRRGVSIFEAGAGGEGHKLGRGFLPARTHSAHLLFQPSFHDAIADFCRREKAHVEREIEVQSDEVFVR